MNVECNATVTLHGTILGLSRLMWALSLRGLNGGCLLLAVGDLKLRAPYARSKAPVL